MKRHPPEVAMSDGMRAVIWYDADGTLTPHNGGVRLVLPDAMEIAIRWSRRIRGEAP